MDINMFEVFLLSLFFIADATLCRPLVELLKAYQEERPVEKYSALRVWITYFIFAITIVAAYVAADYFTLAMWCKAFLWMYIGFGILSLIGYGMILFGAKKEILYMNNKSSFSIQV